MKKLIVALVLTVGLLFTSASSVSEAVALAPISAHHKPGHDDNGKHKGHAKKAKAKGYKAKRHNARKNAHGKFANGKVHKHNKVKPKPHKPKNVKHRKHIAKSPSKTNGPVAPKVEEKIRYIYVPVLIQSKPEVIVETRTKIDRVIYGAGVIALGVVSLALIALFLGFFQGWRRRGKYETEKLKTLLE